MYGSSLGPRARGFGVLAIFFGVAPVQFDGMRPGLLAAPDPEVEELDEDGEAHREVDVALGDVLAEAPLRPAWPPPCPPASAGLSSSKSVPSFASHETWDGSQVSWSTRPCTLL